MSNPNDIIQLPNGRWTYFREDDGEPANLYLGEQAEYDFPVHALAAHDIHYDETYWSINWATHCPGCGTLRDPATTVWRYTSWPVGGNDPGDVIDKVLFCSAACRDQPLPHERHHATPLTP